MAAYSPSSRLQHWAQRAKTALGSVWGTYGLLLLAMILYGSGTPASKVVTQHFPFALASIFQMLVAALVLVPAACLQKNPNKTPLRQLGLAGWAKLALLALIGIVGFNLASLFGMKLIPASLGSVVMALTPVVTAIGAILFLGERLTAMKATALGLASAGMIVLSLNGSLGGADRTGVAALAGAGLIFGAVCSQAAYSLMGKRLTESLNAVQITAAASVLALAMFAPVAAWQWRQFDIMAVPWQAWLAVSWWGVGVMGLGTVLWYKGLHRVQGSIAAAFMGVMPVSALLISYGVLGEAFHWSHIFGLAIELAAIGLIAITRSELSAENGARNQRRNWQYCRAQLRHGFH